MPGAKELAFTPRMVPAEAMANLRFGTLAADLADGPTFAFGLAKKLFDEAVAPTPAPITPKAAAFKEKRKPVFTGR